MLKQAICVGSVILALTCASKYDPVSTIEPPKIVVNEKYSYEMIEQATILLRQDEFYISYQFLRPALNVDVAKGEYHLSALEEATLLIAETYHEKPEFADALLGYAELIQRKRENPIAENNLNCILQEGEMSGDLKTYVWLAYNRKLNDSGTWIDSVRRISEYYEDKLWNVSVVDTDVIEANAFLNVFEKLYQKMPVEDSELVHDIKVIYGLD